MIRVIKSRYDHAMSCPYCRARAWLNLADRFLFPGKTIECPVCKQASKGSALSLIVQNTVAFLFVCIYVILGPDFWGGRSFAKGILDAWFLGYLLTGFLLIFFIGQNKKLP